MTEERAPYDVEPGVDQPQYYIGVKQIEARPMTLGDYYAHHGWMIPSDEDSARPGYLVVHPDGHKSWSPADTFESAFESAYLPMTGSDGTRVTQAMVDEFIVSTEVTRLGNHTVVMATCRNGFTIIAESACVDPANYDEGIGQQIAMEKIRKQVWNHLGFVLACARN